MVHEMSAVPLQAQGGGFESGCHSNGVVGWIRPAASQGMLVLVLLRKDSTSGNEESHHDGFCCIDGIGELACRQ